MEFLMIFKWNPSRMLIFTAALTIALSIFPRGAKADSVAIDSFNITHVMASGNSQDHDHVKLNFTLMITTNQAKGRWAIEEDKAGDIIGGSDNIANGSATGVADAEHIGGTNSYYATVSLYLGSTVIPGTLKYAQGGHTWGS
jgi:hypothetical protein